MPRDARAYLADIVESCDAIAVAVIQDVAPAHDPG
jgi:hypothetical protein